MQACGSVSGRNVNWTKCAGLGLLNLYLSSCCTWNACRKDSTPKKISHKQKKTLQSQSEGNHETPVKDDTDQFHTRMSWSTGETSGWQSVTGIYHASYAQRYFAWDGEWGFISSELGRRCNWYSVISPYMYRACRAMILLVKWKTTVMITARFRLWL